MRSITNRTSISTSVSSQGQALLRLGRLEEGEKRLRTALDTAERRGDRYRQMLALNNLGMRFLNQRRLDEAVPWFTRVVAFSDLQDTSVYAFALNNVGDRKSTRLNSSH